MQPTTSGSSGGAGAGGELSRGGLARFRSAPATWLEALLEDEEEDPLKQSQCLTQLLAGNSTAPAPTTTSRSSVDPGLFDSGPVGFLRQNSSPADFLASDNYFTNLGIPANYDYLSPNIDASLAGEGRREADSEHSSTKFHPHMKTEQGVQLSGSGGSLMEMEMEKLLEDSVPCRVRAKRGFATHPRSIAERVRRTKISDRIRKLQELVPNMDKQTNTADMLEEAVEYVKLLQKQIQELSEHQKNCTCVAREQGS